MFALRQSRGSYYSQKESGVNGLSRMQASANLWYVRFSAVRNETVPPKASCYVCLSCLITIDLSII